MNKKGYTLIEVIVSIMILSIASITLAGSFTTVLNFMSKSNAIKNASDTLFSYIEGSDEDTVREDIKIKKSVLESYTINGMEITGTLNNYQSDKSDDVDLSQFYANSIVQLKDSPSYQDVISYGNTLYNRAKKRAEECDYCQLTGLNDIIKQLILFDYKNTGVKFNSSLLPESMKLEGKEYYLRIFFPWEHDTYPSGGVISGGALIYLSEYSGSGETDIDHPEHNIQIIFDYKEGIWYYHDNRIGNSYMVNTKKTIYLEGADTAFFVNGDGKKIMNYSELMNHIKDPGNNWKYLDKNKMVDSRVQSDVYWVDVK